VLALLPFFFPPKPTATSIANNCCITEKVGKTTTFTGKSVVLLYLSQIQPATHKDLWLLIGSRAANVHLTQAGLAGLTRKAFDGHQVVPIQPNTDWDIIVSASTLLPWLESCDGDIELKLRTVDSTVR